MVAEAYGRVAPAGFVLDNAHARQQSPRHRAAPRPCEQQRRQTQVPACATDITVQLGVAAGTRRRFTAHQRVIAAYQGQRTRSGHGLLRQGESKCRNGHRIIKSTNVFAKRFCATLAKSRKRLQLLGRLERGVKLCVLGGLSSEAHRG